MKEFILAMAIIFGFALALSVGIYSFIKYRKSVNTSISFWKALLILFAYSACSIIIIPVAIAKWGVDTTVDFNN